MSKQNIFSSCSPGGQVNLMGAWYAAIWWKIRSQAASQGPEHERAIDVLFFEHARAFEAGSTFYDASRVAQEKAKSLYEGRYLGLVKTALDAAGL